MPTPLPVLPGVYYGYVWGKMGALTVGNVACFKAVVPATTAANDLVRCQVIADAMPLVWTTTLGPLQASSLTGYDSRVYGLQFPVNPAAFGHHTGAGGNAGQRIAVSTAAVIKHNVLRRGRGSQSHSAFSPLTIGEITEDGQSLSGGMVTGLTEEWENWIAGIQAAALAAPDAFVIEYVQLSRKGAGATYPIISTAAESLLGTERSRTARP